MEKKIIAAWNKSMIWLRPTVPTTTFFDMDASMKDVEPVLVKMGFERFHSGYSKLSKDRKLSVYVGKQFGRWFAACEMAPDGETF